VKVTITYHRTCAHIVAGYSADLNARIKTYSGSRFVGPGPTTWPHWALPARHVPALALELDGAGYDVVVQREERAG
jgi:hypothetical protein